MEQLDRIRYLFSASTGVWIYRYKLRELETRAPYIFSVLWCLASSSGTLVCRSMDSGGRLRKLANGSKQGCTSCEQIPRTPLDATRIPRRRSDTTLLVNMNKRLISSSQPKPKHWTPSNAPLSMTIFLHQTSWSTKRADSRPFSTGNASQRCHFGVRAPCRSFSRATGCLTTNAPTQRNTALTTPNKTWNPT